MQQYIPDLIILGIVILFIIIDARRGLVLALSRLLIIIASFIGAGVITNLFTDSVTLFLRPMINEFLTEALVNMRSNMLDAQAGMDILLGLVNKMIPDPTRMLISFALWGVSFLVLQILLRLAVRAVDGVMQLPILKQANMVGGAIIGLVKGTLVALIGLFIAIKMGLYDPGVNIDDTYIVKHIVEIINKL